MTNELTTTEKGRMYRLARRISADTCDFFGASGSSDLGGLQGGYHEEFDLHTMLKGSFAF